MLHHAGPGNRVGTVPRQPICAAMGPVNVRAPSRDAHRAPPGQRRTPHQPMTPPLAFICSIVALRRARCGWPRRTGGAERWLARLIPTHAWGLRGRRALIHLQPIFPAPDTCGLGRWRAAPSRVHPRVPCAFFQGWRIVSGARDSTWGHAIIGSATSCHVPRVGPAGGVEQATARRGASWLPSTVWWPGRARLWRCSAASRPTSTQVARGRAPVWHPTCQACGMGAADHAGPWGR
jgi:hypothetical protein